MCIEARLCESVSAYANSNELRSDDGQYLVDMLSKGMKVHAEAEVEGIDDKEILFIEAISSADCAIVFHIGGFVVHPCEQCKSAVLGSSSSENAYLTALKEYVCDGNNLHYPSDAVMSTLKSCEEHFRGITTWADNALTMKSIVQVVTAYLRKMLRSNLEMCEQHKEAVEKMLVSSYAVLWLHIHLRQIGAIKINGNASKTCAGVSLP